MFIKRSIDQLKSFNISPKVSILSGGRKEDLGRDERVDKTIKEANHIVDFFKKENPKLKIHHDQILIEWAIEKESNLVLAPDGISGNLIYRSLVHLGGGKAYGAIYLGLNKPVIDTSRVGHIDEINGALILALALLL